MLGAMFFICVSFAQVTNDTVNRVSIPEVKFNPMTLEGQSRVSAEAESNVYSRLAAQYKCDIVVYREDKIESAVSIDKWNAGGEKGYIEIVYCWPEATRRCATLVRRHSPDGRLVSVEITEKLFSLFDAERKLLRAKYLKELGMTEEEAMKDVIKGEYEKQLRQLKESGMREEAAKLIAQQRVESLQWRERLRKAREERDEISSNSTKAYQSLSNFNARLSNHVHKMGGLAGLRLGRENAEEEAERKKFFPPLMPFPEAVEKAKNGDGAALYALALHYAKGKEISQDTENARHYLKKAAEADYPAAVLIDAITKEEEIKGVGGSRIDPETGKSDGFSRISFTGWRYRNEKDPIKDTNVVNAVRSGYKKAASLGLSIATNKLARFEKCIKEIREAADMKEKNAALARELMTAAEKKREIEQEESAQKAAEKD